jgi:short-subunit dehydrogenase
MTHAHNGKRMQVVLVAGASSGIGLHTALCYARRGAHLILSSRDEDALQKVAAQCRRAGAPAVLVHAADIGQSEQVEQLFGEAVERFGHIDVAAQCAAVTAFGQFDDIPAEVFDRVVNTNLLGAANVARCALTQFRAQGAGHLVVVGSLLGTTAVPYQSAYVASKFALNGLVRALRQENRNASGIHIHGIYPGPVDTPVYGNAANYLGRTPRIPPGAYSPESVADAIVCATDQRRSSERQVGIVNWPVIAFYRLLPSVFDAVITPMLHLTNFTARPQSVSSGNAF